jgi:hypothetical protein
MKNKIRILISLLVFVAGSVMLVFLYLYGPTWNTKPVVVIQKTLGTNQIITEADVKIDHWPIGAVPNGAISNLNDVVGKTALNLLPPGSPVFPDWIEKDPLLPKEGEVILPLPSGSIYGVNSSLRAQDEVTLLFYRRVDERSNVTPGSIDPNDPNGEDSEKPAASLIASGVEFKNIRVVSVRSSVGNSVMDTAEGKQNDRITSSDRIYTVEVLVSDDAAKTIKDQLELGYTVWVARSK